MENIYIPPTIIESIRKETDLRDYLNRAVEHAKTNGATPPAFRTIGGILKSAIRDDCSRHMLTKQDLKKVDHQLDHVFEVQYFVATFLYATAKYILESDHTFQPDVSDILFAVLLINSRPNLQPLHITKHKFKTAFFRGAQTKKFVGSHSTVKANLDTLKEYLIIHGAKYNEFLCSILGTVVTPKKYTNANFKNLFIVQLLVSPFCQKWLWDDIFEQALTAKKPFSRNMTIMDYVPHPWLDDNVFYDSIQKHVLAQPTEKESIQAAEEVETYNAKYIYEDIGGEELGQMTKEQLAATGMTAEDDWMY
ncbi:hypothetical protein JR316_0011154 [Psilocybe cubensis]|uniref:Uncharacterized protein n=2 Tax=Psilocybe cubensis TaxID=181762 RepID=A0ACB8GNB3_PSICU|nr:hypothetical protein JR316_0011154 [Psilocybe cubensis]KAH9477235.1 hypothetical protein JR316_0011154 [Psilocybe cubensis]